MEEISTFTETPPVDVRGSGQPTAPPSMALATTATGTRVYASWNGATDVSAWEILAGASPTTLSPVGQFPTGHFETAMWVESTEPWRESASDDSARLPPRKRSAP